MTIFHIEEPGANIFVERKKAANGVVNYGVYVGEREQFSTDDMIYFSELQIICIAYGLLQMTEEE